ncbi:MAG: NUDIX domain-containing protein [Candidatus Nanoarchaeia archaeon]
MNDFIPEETYKEILKNTVVADIDLVVHDKGKILLVYRIQEPEKNQWWLPGGRQKKGIFGEASAIIKAKQETGLDVKVKKLIGVYEEEFYNTPFKGIDTTHHLARAYLVTPVDSNQEVRLDKTSGLYKWINKDYPIADLKYYVRRIINDSGVFKK